ncbi:TetR/AcrR family transcriptional regulator [Salinibacterium soli]|uniref:TetR family transcriptional regulator n=1 Tax=Antiquaquibacter soli TaxID=3064523 RepID=A0ABT9BJ42_9MICO|nr:TetR family transcriptional regulator [Protaetiibacter sp. WY-16]MDO7881046.1 TetR family transcriptional regulator [Protaetiibacter sp. WY-16]
MTASATEELGLRERKRRATRRAIQLAVIDLVGERGLDGTTVDEISRQADISPRTFFNYFASKEDAVVGELPPLPSGELVERFVSAGRGASLLDGLAEIIVETVEGEGHDQELMQRRKSVLQQHPHLFAMRIARMRRLEDEMGSIVARRLLADDPSLEPSVAESRGRLVANVAFAAMRHAWGSWARGDRDSRLADHVTESFAELKIVLSSDAA